MRFSKVLFAAETIAKMREGLELIRHVEQSMGGAEVEGVLEAQALMKIVRAGLYDLRTIRNIPHRLLDELTGIFSDGGIELQPLAGAEKIQRALKAQSPEIGDTEWLAALWELASCLLTDSDEETIQHVFTDKAKDPGFRAVWLLDSLAHEAEHQCQRILRQELEENTGAGRNVDDSTGAMLVSRGGHPNIETKLVTFLAETDDKLKKERNEAALRDFVGGS